MKKVLLAALLLLTTVVAQAEDKGDKLKSYNYVEAQGGLGWTVTNAKIDKLLMPQFGLIRTFPVARSWLPSACRRHTGQRTL